MRVFAYRKVTFSNLADLIGNTPVLKLKNIFSKSKSSIFAKLELMNPSGSIKDRIVLKIIESAERKGILKGGSLIVEATTGNTGMSLAMLAIVKNYRAVLFIPTGTSGEKVEMMKAFGAKVIEVEGDMTKVVEKSKTFARKNKAFLMNQFENQENINAHIKTGEEIFKQMNGKIDAFVAGVGTGGTLIGVAKFLKRKLPTVRIVAVEPKEMPALYSKFYKRRMKIKKNHSIEGIGEGFIPKILEENLDLIDDVVLVSSRGAIKTAQQLVEREGILAGISSGANVLASMMISQKIGGRKNVVTVLPDRGERYFSKKIFK